LIITQCVCACAVQALVAYVRKRDKRVQAYKVFGIFYVY